MKGMSHDIRLARLLLSSSAIACLACPTAGWSAGADPQTAATAQAPSSATTVEDIIVTATRRSERLQDVPIAVRAIGVRLWARNLFDKQYVTNGLQYNFYHVTRAEVTANPGGLGGVDVERVWVAPPRTIGLTFSPRYGS